MTNEAQRLHDAVFYAVRFWRLRVKTRLTRYRRAWHYAVDRLSADEAQQVLIDCRYPAGWHSLLTLTVEDTLEQALDLFMDHPELRRLVADGCARVGYKWESYGDALSAAQDWAIELAQDYASAEGLTLVRRSENSVAGDV